MPTLTGTVREARSLTGYSERTRFKALILAHTFNDMVKGDDGYWVWWPLGNRGCYSADDLEMIALLLNEANRLWDNEIKEYFETHP